MSTALVALVLLPMALTLVVALSLLIAQPLLRPAISAIERARLRRPVARGLGPARGTGGGSAARLRGGVLSDDRPSRPEGGGRGQQAPCRVAVAPVGGGGRIAAAARSAPRARQGRPFSRPPRGDAARTP